MDLTLQDIALRRLRLLTVDPRGNPQVDDRVRLFVLADLARLGYLVINPDAYDDSLVANYRTLIIPTLEKLRGGDVSYAPLFRGFPDELPTDDSFIMRQLLASLRLTFGEVSSLEEALDFSDIGWWPASSIPQDPGQAQADKAAQKKLRPDTHTEWVELRIAPVDEVDAALRTWLENTLYAPTSVKVAEHEDVLLLLVAFGLDWIDHDRVTFRETRSLLFHTMWSANALEELISSKPTPTDLLRLFAAVTETDTSLATPIRFPKMSKRQRRTVLACLDQGATNEEMLRYRDLWLRIGEYVHPGTYRERYPNALERFAFIRAQRRDPSSFNSVSERLHESGEIDPLLEHLTARSTVFARRLRHLLAGRSATGAQPVLDAFSAVASSVPAKALMTLRIHLQTVDSNETRAVINKAGAVKVMAAPSPHLDKKVLQSAITILDTAIDEVLAEQESWAGCRVWIDPALSSYVAPLQQRKVSDGMLNVERGTRLPLDLSKVLRLFVYWHDVPGQQVADLDLSAVTLNEDLSYLSHVDYTRLAGTGIAHSGDLTSAPVGAAEFIDVTLRALPAKARYLVPQIYRFSGPQFGSLSRAHGGWMIRDEVDTTYSTFDVKTVQNAFDLTGGNSFAIPFIVDLKAAQIIYTDLYVGRRQNFNAVRNQVSAVVEISREVVRFTDTRLTLDQLAGYNARARGATVVGRREDADLTFGVDDDCDYTATDVARINADLLG